MTADPRKPWKAIVAGVVAFIGLLWANLEGRQDRLGEFGVAEWLGVLIPTAIAFGATYYVPNPRVG